LPTSQVLELQCITVWQSLDAKSEQCGWYAGG
jgi:hypothetical protein